MTLVKKAFIVSLISMILFFSGNLPPQLLKNLTNFEATIGHLHMCFYFLNFFSKNVLYKHVSKDITFKVI